MYPASILRNGTAAPRRMYHDDDDESEPPSVKTHATTESPLSTFLIYTLAATVVITILGALVGSLCYNGLCRLNGTVTPNDPTTTNIDNSTTMNLLFNGDFTDGLSGWKREWQVEADTTRGVVYIGNAVGYGGRVSQTTVEPLVPDQAYQLVAQLAVRGTTSQPKQIRGGVMFADGSSQALDVMLDNETLQTTTLTFVAGPSTHVSIFFEVGLVEDASSPTTSEHYLVVDSVELLGRRPENMIDTTVLDQGSWNIVGERPVQQQPGSLRFDAIDQCSLDDAWDGCAHVATTTSHRSTRNIFESLSYTATMVGNVVGVETIVTQWRLLLDGDEAVVPIATLYVSDVIEDAPHFFTYQDPVNGTRWLQFSTSGGDGVANNGIVDVFLVLSEDAPNATTTPVTTTCATRSIEQSYSGRFPETVVHLGTVQAGDTLDVYAEQDRGDFLLDITVGGGRPQTMVWELDANQGVFPSSLLLGSYDQARDMETLERAVSCEEQEDLSALEQIEVLLDWYAERPQRESAIDFANLDHQVYDNSVPLDLVFNGDFGLSMSGWRRTGHVEWTRDGVSTAEPDGQDRRGPFYSATSVGNGEDPGRLSQTIKVVPEQDYELSAMIALVGGIVGQAGVALGGSVSGFNVEDPVKTHYFDYTNTTDEFQRVSLVFNAKNSAFITIFFATGEFENASNPVGELIVDDVALRGLPAWDYVEPFTTFDWTDWEIDGEQPVQRDGTLLFDAIEHCTIVPGGDGCRHEAKTARTSLAMAEEQYESLSFAATLDVSHGVEAIVAQWREQSSVRNKQEYNAMATVYVSDMSEDAPNFFTNKDSVNGTRWFSFSDQGGDGVANNGVFDVFVVFKNRRLTNVVTAPFCESGRLPSQSYSGSFEEIIVRLGVIQTGQTFDFHAENNYGKLMVNFTANGETMTASQPAAPTLEGSGFWFGSYDQVRDMESLEPFLSCQEKDILSVLDQSKLFSEWYALRPDRKLSITLSDVRHVRVVGSPPTEPPLPSDLVFNGNFDQRISGWRQGGNAHWAVGGVPTTEPDALDSDGNSIHYGGSVGPHTHGRLSQTIDVLPNQAYELTAMIMMDENRGGEAGIALGGVASAFSVEGAVETLLFEFHNSTEAFQSMSLGFNSGDNKKVTIFFDSGVEDNATVAYLIFDNVKLTGPLPEHFVDPFTLLDWSRWDIEGELPVELGVNPLVLFDPVSRCSTHATSEGCIHEAKTPQPARSSIQNQFESISYQAIMDLSVGVESIITRWPGLAEVVVADVSEDAPNFFTNQDPINGTRWLSFSDQGGDGIGNNRVFDVFAVFRNLDEMTETLEPVCSREPLPRTSYSGLYAETVVHLGVLSGETFSFYGENDHGNLFLNFTVDGETKTATMDATRTNLTSSSLHFGSYDTARDLLTLERVLNCDTETYSMLEKYRLIEHWYTATAGGRRNGLLLDHTSFNHVRVVDKLPTTTDASLASGASNPPTKAPIVPGADNRRTEPTISPGAETPPTDAPAVSGGKNPPTDSDAASLSTDPPAASTSLVFNGNFNSGFSGWRQEEQAKWPGFDVVDRKPVEHTSEKHPAQGTVSVGNNVGRLSQTLVVVPNEDYSLSATVLVPTEFVGQAGVVMLDAESDFRAENTSGVSYFDFSNATGDFQSVTLSFNAGASERLTVFFDALLPAGPSAGHLTVDDVVLDGPISESFVNPNSAFDWSSWEIEGEHPVVSATQLRWDALNRCVAHRDGYMHAARTAADDSAAQNPLLLETLNYTATIDMSNGVETIVTGWVGAAVLFLSDDATKVFVNNTDTNSGTRWPNIFDQGGDGVASNGVFDVFLVFQDANATSVAVQNNCTDGGLPQQSYSGYSSETVVHMGTLTSGDSFDFYGQKDGSGEYLFEVTIHGESKTATWSSNSTSPSTLWFGTYDQARDMETREPVLTCEHRNTLSVLEQTRLLRSWYADQPERRSSIEMVDVAHTQIVREA